MRALRAGDPLSEETEVGPLIDAAAVERIEAQLEDALACGARLHAGGERLREDNGQAAGNLYAPTALADVPAGAAIMREETFGPMAPVVPFDRDEEVIAAANGLPWGLAAYVFGDPERAERLAERLAFGVIGVNDPIPAAPDLPFGGVKRSGIGKEGGRAGIEEYLDLKLISCAAWGNDPGRPAGARESSASHGRQ